MSKEDQLIEMIYPEEEQEDREQDEQEEQHQEEQQRDSALRSARSLSDPNLNSPLANMNGAPSGGRVSFSDPENVPTVGLRRSSSVPSSTMRSQESQDEEEMRDNFPTLSVNTSPAYVSRPNSIPEADDDDTEEESTSKSLGRIDIAKLTNNMKLRSAYLNYADTNESCDEYDNDDNNRNDDWGNVVEEDNRDDDSDENLDESDKDIDVSGGGTSATARRPSVDDASKPVVTKQLSASSFDSHSSGDDSPTHRRKKVKSERDNTILTFEIFAKGDNKYCHRSMRNLFLYMLKSCQSQDAAGATPTFSFNENAPRGNVDDWARQQSTEPPSNPPPGVPAATVTSNGIGYMQLRDLRRLEYLFTPQEEPAIFVRRHAVVISLDPLRVVVMADRLILLVPDGADTLIQLLSNQMQAYIGDSSLSIPFEMQAFEAIFGTVIEIQKLHLSDLEARIKKVSRILRKYSIVPVEVQEKVQQFKQRVSEMIERARGHKRILEELLEEDDHLALMALTLLKDKPHLYNVPLEQAILSKREDGESLLESYLMDYNSLQSKLTLLNSQLNGAESLVSLRLDTSRNELLITNTVVSVVSCTFAVGGYVGALFGMNLRNGFEDDNSDTFWTVSIATSVLVILSTICTIIYLKYAEILPSRFNYLSKHEITQL